MLIKNNNQHYQQSRPECTCTNHKFSSPDRTVCCLFRNGTGSGGTEQELEQKKCDYEQAIGRKLYFQHGETSKQLIIRVNPDCTVINQVKKN